MSSTTPLRTVRRATVMKITTFTVVAARGITGLMGVAVLAWLWVRLL